MSENKDKVKKEKENLNLISEPENKLSRDTPAMVNFSCYGHCPICGKFVNGPEDNFCPNCGQALLWPSFPKLDRKSAEDSLEEDKTDQPDLTGEADEKEDQGSAQQEQEDPNEDGSLFKIKI